MRTRRMAAVSAVAITTMAACSVTSPVAVERSDRTGTGPVVPDGQAGLPPTAETSTSQEDTELPVAEQPVSTLSWGDCSEFDIPSPDQLGTSGWECTTLSNAMDSFGDGDVGDAVVELALTRHPATGERRGTILINPGGPGGAGLPTAWNVRGGMPIDLLRAFDIVSWDPRGVGQSRPAIDCNDDVPPGDPGFIAGCVAATGPLAGFLTAPYSAADMEAIRVALGEDTLNYLGYSYGSVLGSTYASAHPERVGAFVLDGVTDPRAGSTDGPFEDGFAVLADDGTEAAIDRFSELCDATEHCLFSLDAATVISDLGNQVSVLPTSNFAGGPELVDTAGYRQLLDSSMAYAGDWELLATALEDADRGDASALAALIAGENSGDQDAADGDGVGESDFAEANFMIYCADLGPLITEWSFCADMPDNGRRMQPVQAVDVDREILVIGTEYDPLTPGYHAPDFAAALGDAVHMIWEGVGHTAFPGWTPCIDEVVADQFLRRSLPDDGMRCTFLAEIDDDTTLADELFGQGDVESGDLLERVLAGRDLEPESECIAGVINQSSDRVISHVILDVTSDDAGIALDDARQTC